MKQYDKPNMAFLKLEVRENVAGGDYWVTPSFSEPPDPGCHLYVESGSLDD